MNRRHAHHFAEARIRIGHLTMANFGFLIFFVFGVFAKPVDSQSSVELGRSIFQRNCGTCHGGDGLGGEMGPNLAYRQARLSNDQLSTILRDGIQNRGMPAFPSIETREKSSLMAFLRTIRMDQRPAPAPRTVELTDGKQTTGLVMNESPSDMQMRSADGLLHLLRREETKFKEVTSQADWTTYNGTVSGNRFSTLDQITKTNISKLVPKWIFPMEGITAHNETTPVVVKGIMYVTSGNECWALDAGSGREIWHFQRPRTIGLIGNAAQGTNGEAGIGLVVARPDDGDVALDSRELAHGL